LENNMFNGVYCHYDGDLNHVGLVLHLHYQDENKIRELISHGSMSSLSTEIGEKHEYLETSKKVGIFDYQCTFYHRDMDRDLEIFKMSIYTPTLRSKRCYIFNNGKWTFRDRKGAGFCDLEVILRNSEYLPA